MKKILLIEPDKEQGELFTNWLKEEAYSVNSFDKIQEVQASISKEKFDIILMDIDEPKITEASLKLCQTLKANERFADLPIAILTYRKDSKKIASAIEAGVDSFMLKPFETDLFLKRIETIFKQIEFKKQGKKVLDLNYINYLIALANETERENFFILAPVIFNKLIMEKINTILGEPIVMTMLRRVQELTEDNYAFMKQTKFQNGQLLMDEVDKVSKDVSVETLTNGFRDSVYAFLHLVQTLTSDILMGQGKV